jgi:hypothetical protein
VAERAARIDRRGDTFGCTVWHRTAWHRLARLVVIRGYATPLGAAAPLEPARDRARKRVACMKYN